MSIEQKLKNLGDLSQQVSEAERVLKLRMGQYDDAFRDLLEKDLGYKIDNDKINFKIHQLLVDAIRVSNR